MPRYVRGWGILLPILFVVCLSACVKNVDLIPVGTTTTPGTTTPVSTSTTSSTSAADKDQKLIAQGTFVNRVHTVKGTVSVYEKGSSRILTFTNFSTDSGPDLRIYVAEDAALTNFIEVSKLSNTGTFSVDLPYNYSPTQHKTVIIWCKAFSVLFGTAALTLN
ncbi:hypothetical protein GCM10028806_55590 [Spirosoma terrae]